MKTTKRNRGSRIGSAAVLLAGLVASVAGCREKAPAPTKTARLGDVVVEVRDVKLLPNRGRGHAHATERGGDPCLAVSLEIRNVGTRKIDYAPWSAGVRDAHDADGNTYHGIQIPAKVFEARPVADSIYPGKSIVDIVGFQAPTHFAREVVFKLDAASVGLDGDFALAVPVAGLSLP